MKLDLLSDSVIHLTAIVICFMTVAKKKVIKLSATHLLTTLLSNRSSGFSCGCKPRTIQALLQAIKGLLWGGGGRRRLPSTTAWPTMPSRWLKGASQVYKGSAKGWQRGLNGIWVLWPLRRRNNTPKSFGDSPNISNYQSFWYVRDKKNG